MFKFKHAVPARFLPTTDALHTLAAEYLMLTGKPATATAHLADRIRTCQPTTFQPASRVNAMLSELLMPDARGLKLSAGSTRLLLMLTASLASRDAAKTAHAKAEGFALADAGAVTGDNARTRQDFATMRDAEYRFTQAQRQAGAFV